MDYAPDFNMNIFYRSIFLFHLYLLQILVTQTEFTMNEAFSFAFFRVSVQFSSQMWRSSAFLVLVQTKIKAMIGRPVKEETMVKGMQGRRETSERGV